MRTDRRMAVVWCAAALLALTGCSGHGDLPRARTLFVLGDSYTVLSAPHMIEMAKAADCELAIDTHFARPGWTAREFLSIENLWAPALRAAAQPVVIYLTLGFNDMALIVKGRRTPREAADDLTRLIDRIRVAIGDAGGRIIQIGYDDACRSTQATCRNPCASKRFSVFYGFLPPADAHYRFQDVRGWLGDSLGSEDGIHMTEENYRDQAALLWKRVFAEEFGCRDPK